MGHIGAIRVPLKVAVRFVASLFLREEAAFPESALDGPQISKEPDHPFMKCEKAATEWGEKELADAQKRGKIPPFATAATVKTVLGCNFDAHPPEFYEPDSFKFNWI
jgi:hypothetical protein